MKRLTVTCAGLLLAATACAPTAHADGLDTALDQAARIPTTQIDFATCVQQRESKGVPTARGENGTAAGLFQFIDSKWRHGLAHMVAERLMRHGVNRTDALAIRTQLRAMPIWRWDARLQITGFIAALNADGPWTGWRHWHLAGSRCNQLVPASAR